MSLCLLPPCGASSGGGYQLRRLIIVLELDGTMLATCLSGIRLARSTERPVSLIYFYEEALSKFTPWRYPT